MFCGATLKSNLQNKWRRIQGHFLFSIYVITRKLICSRQAGNGGAVNRLSVRNRVGSTPKDATVAVKAWQEPEQAGK